MVAALVARFEIDFSRIIITEIHQRSFIASTPYLFPCHIFQLCRDAGVPIWHCDKLIRSTGTLNICLIGDEANDVAPRIEPHVEVPIMGEKFVDVVEKMHDADPAPSVHTDDAPTSSPYAASRAFRSSRSTPPLGVHVVRLARVQKLEA